MTITEEFRSVLETLQAGHPIVFVSGQAGTGKSTLIQYIRNTWSKNIVVVAPTGVAALNVEGATINSFFGFPPRAVTDADIKVLTPAARRLYIKLDLLIVDEVSMVRADVMDAMDKFLRLNGREPLLPFGGTQVLLVGDLFQLPPVVTRSEERQLFTRRYASPYFFSAEALQGATLLPIGLTRCFRQVDPAYAEILNKVRSAEEVEAVVEILNSSCTPSRSDREPLITLTCTNAAADQLNRGTLARLSGEARVFTGQTQGRVNIEETRLPAPMQLELKVGARVMFTKTGMNRSWMNGTLGRVTELGDDTIQVELLTNYPGAIVDVHRETWESYRYRYDYDTETVIPTIMGSYVQFPLTLGWAVTIHKSQGQTLQKVNIDLGYGAFAPGQVYVALSRCRSLDDLRLMRPIAPRDVICDPRIKRFYLALRAAGFEGRGRKNGVLAPECLGKQTS